MCQHLLPPHSLRAGLLLKSHIPGNPQNSTPLHAPTLFTLPGGTKVAQGKGKL